MDYPDNISFMMSFLKQFNYPLIHGMTYEEMANVFHISNRCFLVCWVLKLLDEECYLDVLRDREHDKELLGSLVQQHGFCTCNEKIGLFNGDLPVAEQVQILHRIFKFIKRFKQEGCMENQVPLTLENLQTLINININIFPTFGEIKTFSDKEKLIQINILHKEIEKLKLTSKNTKSLNEESNTKICQINKSQFRTTIEKLSENFYQFDRIIKAAKKKNSYEIKSDYKISPMSEELLLNCNNYLKIVSQYMEDLRTINTFSIEDAWEPDDEICSLIGILAEQIHTTFRTL